MSTEPLHTPEEGDEVSESAEAEVRYLHPVEDTPVEPAEQDAGQDAEPTSGEPDQGGAQATVEDATGDLAGAEPGTGRGRFAAVSPWLVQTFTPASGLYTERQPTIAETVRRARDGDQLPDSGPLRVASQAHGYSHAALVAVADTVKWLSAHPARLGVLFTLLAVALAFPATRHLAGSLLSPIVWAQQGLL